MAHCLVGYTATGGEKQALAIILQRETFLDCKFVAPVHIMTWNDAFYHVTRKYVSLDSDYEVFKII